MNQNIYRIINSCGVAIAASGVNIYYTVQRNSIDYQAHSVVSIIGSTIPGIIAGFAFYWWESRRAKHKQKKLSSITPQEATRLAASNIDGQNDDAINSFLRNASARDIQEFILNIHEQSGYIHHARAALDIRLAEDAEITSRHTVHLTWALLVVSAALLAFPFLQMTISKNHEVVKAVVNDANARTVTQTDRLPVVPETADSEFYRQKKLAESGDAAAQLNLGNCYITGKGVRFDLVEGLKWIRKAADQGNPDAQLLLGLYYKAGTGVAQNYVQAWKWLKLAEALIPNAIIPRVACESSMTPDQIAEAQRLSHEFQPHKESASDNSK